MTNADDYVRVMRHYPADCRPQRTEPLGSAGGFSGARFWQLETPRGPLCLRRWPQAHPSPEHLRWIHAVLGWVSDHGFAELPLPIAPSLDRASFVHHGGHLWELTPWLPGSPDAEHPTGEARLRAAMAALGQFHRAAESFPLGENSPSPSPGIAARLETLGQFTGRLDEFRQAVEVAERGKLRDVAHQVLDLLPLLAGQLQRDLAAAVDRKLDLRPSIRDIHRQHVLFDGNRLSGLIDFGAMRVETRCGDVARLLGSLAGDDAAARSVAMRAYTAERPLSRAEQSLVDLFDRSGVVLSPLNWIAWTFVENRCFEAMDAVLERFQRLAERMEWLARSTSL